LIPNYANIETLRDRSNLLSKKLSQKILIQVEGSTCSGKTTFLNDIKQIIESMAIDCVLIEESASKIIEKNPLIFNDICNHGQNSKIWKNAKTELQQMIVLDQVVQLEKLSTSKIDLALMDRGGASSAFFMDSLVSSEHFKEYEETCRNMSNSAKLVLLLSPLGFLETANFRYQKKYSELTTEYQGIKKYIEKWGIKFTEIHNNERLVRNKIGVAIILYLLNQHGLPNSAP
jgi:thymidylate kinase